VQHRRKRKVFLTFLFALMSTYAGPAQEEHQHNHESGEQVGKVNFVVSCSPQAQRQFNLAVAWLHSFEYGESERAFNRPELQRAREFLQQKGRPQVSRAKNPSKDQACHLRTRS
jgi:hypothetical protein